jgi:hypothetical protein
MISLVSSSNLLAGNNLLIESVLSVTLATCQISGSPVLVNGILY